VDELGSHQRIKWGTHKFLQKVIQHLLPAYTCHSRRSLFEGSLNLRWVMSISRASMKSMERG
jgi:hypothetical protein